MEQRKPADPWLLSAGVVLGALSWMCVAAGISGSIVAAILTAEGVPSDQLGAGVQHSLEQPGWLGFATLLQFAGWAVLGALGMQLVPALKERRTARGWAAATVVGLTGGTLAGAVATWLGQLGLESPALDLVSQALRSGTLPGRLLFLGSVVLAAPIVEELLYRGVLWGALAQRLSPVAVWGLTSLLFCASHLDPVQSPALLTTALLFGWLRWATGGLAAPILAHLLNNVVATASAMLWPELESLPRWAAGVGVLGAASAVGLLWPPPPQEPPAGP